MILTAHNLEWDCASPSHYKLLHTVEASNLDVSYLGDQWCLFLEHRGEVSTQLFPSRDAAFTMVASAFAREEGK